VQIDQFDPAIASADAALNQRAFLVRLDMIGSAIPLNQLGKPIDRSRGASVLPGKRQRYRRCRSLAQRRRRSFLL
jgi:hypothetical protein